jgi:diguanylate cyclase (GGDEF)-like protein
VPPQPATSDSAADLRPLEAKAADAVDEAHPASALIVLAALDHLSGERDCEKLHASMIAILADASGAEEVVLHRLADDHFEPMLAARGDGATRRVDVDGPWPVPAALVDTAHASLARNPQGFGSLMLENGILAHGLNDNKGLSGIITLRYPDSAFTRPWWISSFLKVYQNHVNLINDAECDTLTGLFNRKTFESRINRILAMQREAQAFNGLAAHDRRVARPGEAHWLAVVDIDHFKSINDRFGHLYGDEVLILLSRLMMRAFRMEDRLFRFGGEEFVIVLSPCAAAGAAMVLERFRSAIENFDFPQVGRVTVSLGYTRVRLDDMPSVAVGRADEALYYAKRNGRNRVCSYEVLAAAGEVNVPAALESEVTLF